MGGFSIENGKGQTSKPFGLKAASEDRIKKTRERKIPKSRESTQIYRLITNQKAHVLIEKGKKTKVALHW